MQCCSTTSITQRQESLIRVKPGHRIHLALVKLKMTFSSKPPHQRTILKDWEDKCIVATKQHRGVYKDTLHQPQNTNSLRDTGEWSSNVSLLSNFTPRMWRLGPAQMETTDKTRSPWGGLTVQHLLITRAIVLLWFCIMHQWLHHFWIIAKSLLRETATAGLSAGLRTTPNNVESSA